MVMAIGHFIVFKSISKKIILLSNIIGIKFGTIFNLSDRSDQTRQRLIYNDMMQRLIPRQSRGFVGMGGSRIQGTLI